MAVFIFIIMIIIFGQHRGEAASQYFLNGKPVDGPTAAIASQDPKNEIMSCDKVVLKMNDKGTMGLKKDNSGSWIPLHPKK